MEGLFIKHMDSSLRNLKALFPDRRMVVRLTDTPASWAVFALAVHAGIEVTVLVQEDDGMTEEDLTGWRKICEGTGTPFIFEKRKKWRHSSQREKLYRAFTSNLADSPEMPFFTYGQYDVLTDTYGKCILLDGGTWDGSSGYMGFLFNGRRPEPWIYEWLGVRKYSAAYSSLTEYFSHTRAFPDSSVNTADRFVWEQETACRQSVSETGLDMLEGIGSFNPFNSAGLISMIFSYPEREAEGPGFFTAVMRRALPKTAMVPYPSYPPGNTHGESSLEEMREKIRRFTARATQCGTLKTVGMYTELRRKRKKRNA